MDFRIGAGKQLSGWIMDVNFSGQRTSGVVDGLRGAHEFPAELTVWKLRQCKIRCQTRGSRLRILFRYIDIHAQPVSLRQVEHVGLHASGASRVDESADIGITRGNNSVEGSVDFLEGLQGLELFHVGLIGVDDRFVCVVSTDGIVGVLLRYRVSLQQVQIAIPGDFGQPKVGLCGFEIAARLP